MNAEEIIKNHTIDAFIDLGFSRYDAVRVGANAVRKYKQNTRHQNAISDALTEGKKLYKKVGK